MGKPSKKSQIDRWLRENQRNLVTICMLGAVIIAAMIGLQNNLAFPSEEPLAPQSNSITINWLPETVKRWHDPIEAMAAKYQIDPNLLAIIMTMESGGYSKAGSPVGAQGLMQIMPGTAGDIARKHLVTPQERYDIFDPTTNIEFGAAYLSYLRQSFGTADQAPSWDSTVELVAAGYNGGPGTARKLADGQAVTNRENISYTRDVSNMWRERNALISPTYQRWLDRGGSELVAAAQAEQ